MRFCKNCLHFNDVNRNFRMPPVLGGPKCKNPMAKISTDLVWGNDKYDSCQNMRNDINSCGPLAIYYEVPK